MRVSFWMRLDLTRPAPEVMMCVRNDPLLSHRFLRVVEEGSLQLRLR